MRLPLLQPRLQPPLHRQPLHRNLLRQRHQRLLRQRQPRRLSNRVWGDFLTPMMKSCRKSGGLYFRNDIYDDAFGD